MIQIVEYICPKCKGKLKEICLTSYPPQYKTYCPNCGWMHIEQSQIIYESYPINNNNDLVHDINGIENMINYINNNKNNIDTLRDYLTISIK